MEPALLIAHTCYYTVAPAHRLARAHKAPAHAWTLRLFLRRPAYVKLEHSFDWAEIAKDLAKRSYITAGFVASVLLIPLAATSTNALIRRLQGRRWKRLHSTVYLIATLAVLHFLWLVKVDIREPLIYSIALTTLLAFRIPALRVPGAHQSGPTGSEPTPAKFL
jgi:DMSO/TMAO reductase YedYZ heme-binding membrane subunit